MEKETNLDQRYADLDSMEPGKMLDESDVLNLLKSLPADVSKSVRASLAHAMATDNLGDPHVNVRQVKEALFTHTNRFLGLRRSAGGDTLIKKQTDSAPARDSGVEAEIAA